MTETLKPYICLKTESGCETVYYSALYDGVPCEFKLLAENELKETEANTRKGLSLLKENLEEDEKLLSADNFLLAFLRNQKFDFEKSKIKLQKFIPKYRELKKYLNTVDIKTLEEIIDNLGFGMLPYRDKHGRVIIYSHPDGLKIEKFSMHDVFGLVTILLLLLLLRHPLTSITGIVYFGECKRIQFHVLHSFIKAVRHFLPLVAGTPIRVPRIEALNINPIFQGLLELIRPLLSKKLFSRFYFHKGDLKSLHKVYDPRLLPEEFGGSMGRRNNVFYKEELLEYIKELKNEKIPSETGLN